MIKNIGFESSATRTINMPDYYKNTIFEKMKFPLISPKFKLVNLKMDRKYCEVAYGTKPHSKEKPKNLITHVKSRIFK